VTQVHDLFHRKHADAWTNDAWVTPPSVYLPGRPDRPHLVNPGSVPKRKLGSIEGRAALLHAIAHIEFNAINLALDAVQRFPDMPGDYYTDWLKVADEEALHFSMVREYLQALGFDYGDFPAHNGIWEMAESTEADVLDRMALVPRVLEARGLDVTPAMQQRLGNVGDRRAVDILDVIFQDEVGHVATGSRWFCFLCKQRNLEPLSTFQRLLKQYFPKGLVGPFNLEARERAGFSQSEIRWLTQDLL